MNPDEPDGLGTDCAADRCYFADFKAGLASVAAASLERPAESAVACSRAEV